MSRRNQKRVFAAGLSFFIMAALGLFLSFVHSITAGDAGLSGGAFGTTTTVTGTDVKCDQPGGSGEECIEHTHQYDSSTTVTVCIPASRTISPGDAEKYCVNQSIAYSLSRDGSDIPGVTTTTHSNCKICQAASAR